jgi:short-subunit dehydrogenase
MGRIASFGGLGCLVTGASSGIGREIARILAGEGARLVLTARRRERLDALAEEARSLGAAEAHALEADLSDPAAPERLALEAERLLGAVDVLVNNAGFSVPGAFHRADPARTLAMVQVNATAAVTLMRRLLPGMLARDRGGVLTVSSVAGFQCAPFTSCYSGTKAFLLNLSEGVHQETRQSGVSVTALCPGVTDTEFFDAAGYRNLGPFLKRRASARKVAVAGVEGLRRGRMTVVVGFTNRMLLLGARLVPRRIAAGVSRRLMGGRTVRSGGER